PEILQRLKSITPNASMSRNRGGPNRDWFDCWNSNRSKLSPGIGCRHVELVNKYAAEGRMAGLIGASRPGLHSYRPPGPFPGVISYAPPALLQSHLHNSRAIDVKAVRL